MLIVCEHCQRQLNLPDEKVPDRPFALSCPGCQGRLQIDPTREPPPADDAAAAVPAGAGEVRFEPLPPLRDEDRNLLGSLFPDAVVVDLSGGGNDYLDAVLRLVGMREVRRFTDLGEATEAIQESECSILLIVLERATAPPCEPLEPLYKLPLAMRRNTFVAVVAPNVKSLDGQTAFYLQVNCLLSSQEPARIPVHLQRALVFHLRQYRHWGVQEE